MGTAPVAPDEPVGPVGPVLPVTVLVVVVTVEFVAVLNGVVVPVAPGGSDTLLPKVPPVLSCVFAVWVPVEPEGPDAVSVAAVLWDCDPFSGAHPLSTMVANAKPKKTYTESKTLFP